MSKLGVIVKNVTASAAKGNIRAAELIFTKLEKIVGVDDLRPPTELTPEQQDFWNAMAKTMTFKIMLWKEQNQREDAKKAAAAAANKPNQIPNHDPVDNDTSTSDSASEDFAAGDIRMPER